MGEFVHEGLVVETSPDVYVPNEDTFLLARHAAVGSDVTVVEVGCGAAVASLAAARSGARVLAVDVNPKAAALAARNARRNGLRVDVVVGDLLSCVRADRMDVMLTNPPYLPTADDEHVHGPLDAAFDGGPDGMRVVARLVDQLEAASGRLPAGFRGLVVASTLQDLGWLRARLDRAGFQVAHRDAERLPFEGLVLLEFVPSRRASP